MHNKQETRGESNDSKFPVHQAAASSSNFGHAVVTGSSIAGLLAARVLADHFAQVTVIERDRLPATPDFRQGVPQARHTHLLPLRGQTLLEQQFPGLLAELQANGATSISENGPTSFFLDGAWHDPVTVISCSRPLLDTIVYQRVVAQANVQVIEGHEVVGLEVDRSGQRVTGVHLGQRGLASHQTTLAANLIVDASGRGSRAPVWLANLGYTPPSETTINVFSGYASRIYRRPAQFNGDWQMMMIKRIPPDSIRGGMIVPLEDDRWHVTLAGVARDYPPTNEAGFLEFARSLPSPRLYDAIKAAEPLSNVSGFRNTENRLRHYEQLPRYLEGFLVCGDAVHALSPLYAQGMTAAALDSQVLAQCLQTQQPQSGLAGLARTFQQQLHKATSGVWQLVTNDERRWPMTEVTTHVTPVRPRIPCRRSNTIPLPVPAIPASY